MPKFHACFIAAFVGGSASGQIVIDDFSTGFHPVTVDSKQLDAGIGTQDGLATSAVTQGAGILGTRMANIIVEGALASSNLSANCLEHSTNTQLVFSNGASFGPDARSNFSLVYSGFNQDLSSMGAIAFDLTFSDLDGSTTSRFLPVTLGVNGVEQDVLISGEGTYSIALSAFAGADLTNVSEFSFAFSTGGISGVDLIFDNLVITSGGVVPTPGSAALFGLAGLIGARRRSH